MIVFFFVGIVHGNPGDSFLFVGIVFCIMAYYKPSWWFQPHLKNMSQIGNLPQIGVKMKNSWNHHLETLYNWVVFSRMYIPNKQTFPKDPAEPETEICALRFRVHEVDGATTSRQKKGGDASAKNPGWLHFNIIVQKLNTHPNMVCLLTVLKKLKSSDLFTNAKGSHGWKARTCIRGELLVPGNIVFPSCKIHNMCGWFPKVHVKSTV